MASSSSTTFWEAHRLYGDVQDFLEDDNSHAFPESLRKSIERSESKLVDPCPFTEGGRSQSDPQTILGMVPAGQLSQDAAVEILALADETDLSASESFDIWQLASGNTALGFLLIDAS